MARAGAQGWVEAEEEEEDVEPVPRVSCSTAVWLQSSSEELCVCVYFQEEEQS